MSQIAHSPVKAPDPRGPDAWCYQKTLFALAQALTAHVHSLVLHLRDSDFDALYREARQDPAVVRTKSDLRFAADIPLVIGPDTGKSEFVCKGPLGNTLHYPILPFPTVH